jgi:hypothetical protein
MKDEHKVGIIISGLSFIASTAMMFIFSENIYVYLSINAISFFVLILTIAEHIGENKKAVEKQ